MKVKTSLNEIENERFLIRIKDFFSIIVTIII